MNDTHFHCNCSENRQGLHCEHVPRTILIRQYMSKAFGYIAILALASVMDILKYGFGIDPVEEEKALSKRQKQAIVIDRR